MMTIMLLVGGDTGAAACADGGSGCRGGDGDGGNVNDGVFFFINAKRRLDIPKKKKKKDTTYMHGLHSKTIHTPRPEAIPDLSLSTKL